MTYFALKVGICMCLYILTDPVKNQIFITPILILCRYIKAAESLAVTPAKAHSAKLHWWRIDDNLCYLTDSRIESNFPCAKSEMFTTRMIMKTATTLLDYCFRFLRHKRLCVKNVSLEWFKLDFLLFLAIA